MSSNSSTSSSATTDIQLAAEALQSLRSSSASSASSSTATATNSPTSSTTRQSSLPPIVLPPILPHSDPFYQQRNSKHHHSSSTSSHQRTSPYHSRSSSISAPSATIPDTMPTACHSPATSTASSSVSSPILNPNSHQALPSIDYLSEPPSTSLPTSPSPPEGFDSSTSSSNNKRTFNAGFLNPLVSSAAKIYEHGKSFSPRFKYSAEKLESVISYGMNSNTATNNDSTTTPSPTTNTTPTSTTTIPPLNNQIQHSPSSSSSATKAVNKKPRTRSAWQGVLVTASSIATSLSYENKQRLRYCLHILKLANTHIASKVNQLQELLQEERATAMAQSIAANHVPHYNNPNNNNNQDKNNFLGQKVNLIKRDIVWTIRKVITALSTYAGNSLPEPARSHVRNYILRLPARWAATFTPSNPTSAASTRCSTPFRSPHLGKANLNTLASATNGIKYTSSATNNAQQNQTDQSASLSPVQTNSSSTSNDFMIDNTSSPSLSTNTDASSTFLQSPSSPAPKASNGSTPKTNDLNNILNNDEQSNNNNNNNNNNPARAHTDAEIGNRVLTLATEALEMLGSIITIVDETLDRAEVWCDRFGRAGITTGQGPSQRQQQQLDQTEATTTASEKSESSMLKQRGKQNGTDTEMTTEDDSKKDAEGDVEMD